MMTSAKSSAEAEYLVVNFTRLKKREGRIVFWLFNPNPFGHLIIAE